MRALRAILRALLLAALPALGCSRAPAASTSAPTAQSASTSLATAPASAPSAAQHPSHVVHLAPQADGDLVSAIRTERLAAKSQGRLLVVYVSATWCEPCRAFHAALESGKLDARLDGLTLLELDVDRDGERIAASGYASKFIPFFALPGPDGSPTSARIEYTGKKDGAVESIAVGLEGWLRAR